MDKFNSRLENGKLIHKNNDIFQEASKEILRKKMTELWKIYGDRYVCVLQKKTIARECTVNEGQEKGLH